MRIILTGSFSVGKTSVMRELKKQLSNISFLDEVARDLILSQNKKPEQMEVHEQEDFQKKILFTQMYQESFTSCFVSDRGVIDTLAYTKDLDMYERVYDMIEDYIHLSPYTHVFFIPKEFPLVDDGVRNTDEEFQIEIENRVLEILRKLEIKHIPLTGSVEKRVQTVLEHIKSCM
ncbi:MAG: ATP-binding protein [Patescibacteria group bacterium]|nr:ATP-binding protein [Patescibacteria group bacterium]